MYKRFGTYPVTTFGTSIAVPTVHPVELQLMNMGSVPGFCTLIERKITSSSLTGNHTEILLHNLYIATTE